MSQQQTTEKVNTLLDTLFAALKTTRTAEQREAIWAAIEEARSLGYQLGADIPRQSKARDMWPATSLRHGEVLPGVPA